MKNIRNLFSVVLLLASCNSSEKLDRETAFNLIQDNKVYPKMISYNIFIFDPNFAKRILDADLEETGLVRVQRTRKLGDVIQPIISFTAKANPYLLPQSNQDKSDGIQRVKIAEEVVEEVTGVQMLEDDKKAVVEVRTSFQNITPFSKLSKLIMDKGNKQKVNLVLYDNGWRIEL